MKFKPGKERTQDLTSSRANQALLESIDNKLASLDTLGCQPTYKETYVVEANQQTQKISSYIKSILTLICFLVCFTLVISIIVLLDFYLISENKKLEKQLNLKKLITTTESPLPTTTTEFKWNHCGQTHTRPSIYTKILKPSRPKRIVGGEDAVNHSWPFLASLRIKLNNTSEHHCGATLISEDYVLTAAHCILIYVKIVSKYNMTWNKIFSLVEVQVGLNQHQAEPKTPNNDYLYEVEYFLMHENFDYSFAIYNDLALVKLKRKVNLNRPDVNIVCLPNEDTQDVDEGHHLVALGWGAYAEEFNYTAFTRDQLQQAVFTVKNINDTLCNFGDVGQDWDRENTICAHSEKRSDKLGTCYGDSGGPVLAYRNDRWTLLGVVSFGHDVRHEGTYQKRCNASLPSYFVRLKNYAEWIHVNTNLTFV